MSGQPLTIEALGGGGDGVARGPDGQPVYVPFALPGETVANAGHGPLAETSPDRVEPPCPHFKACGGCVAQHMSDALYAGWKRDLVVTALRQRGLDAEVADLVRVPPRSRRRATVSIARRGAVVGFHRHHSEEVIDLAACPVVTPAIEAALPGLRRLAAALPGLDAATRIAIADLDGRLDVAVTGLASALTGERRAGVARAAAAAGIARLSIEQDIVVERETPLLATAAGAVAPPPGAFFQAVAAAEQAIVETVLAGLPKKAKRVADLFCGVGTLTLPLARRARVFALDGDKTALAALDDAARRNQGLKPIETRRRDLFREPLSRKELESLDAVVLDPPRAGAREQCMALAEADVPVVAMVSCHPATLARDLRVLVGGGYRLGLITPIDQFLWSAHVECVAILTR
jgi:23S rRNA (uracil1939-C5)-methyltransferase